MAHEKQGRVMRGVNGCAGSTHGGAGHPGAAVGGRHREVNSHPILVVDDEPYIRGLLEDTLSEAGYEVDSAQNGEVALERFQDVRYHVVLLDLTMPGMGGIEVLERIREIDDAVLFIVVTADCDSDAVLESMRKRVVDYLTKPFLIATLLESVSHACQTYDKARESRERVRAVEEENRCLHREGTELRERVSEVESQNDAILRHMNSGLVFLDTQGTIRYANPLAASILDTEIAKLLGRSYAEAFALNSTDREALRAALSCGATQRNVEVSLHLAEGLSKPISINAARVPGSENSTRGIVLVFVDLTHKKEVEARVRRLDRLAAMGELAAGIVHEVRNPLAGIQTAAELLDRRLEPGDHSHRYATVVMEEVGRLDRLLNDLLEYARPGARAVREAELGPVVRRAVQMVEGAAKAKGARLSVELPDQLPPLPIDQDKIECVLINVMRNAIDSVRDENGFVEVSVRLTSDGSSVRIEVVDNGGGIDPKDLKRLLRPFETTKPRGTGLGLPISARIVGDHAGRFDLHGRPGLGSVATIELPLRASDDASGGHQLAVSSPGEDR